MARAVDPAQLAWPGTIAGGAGWPAGVLGWWPGAVDPAWLVWPRHLCWVRRSVGVVLAGGPRR